MINIHLVEKRDRTHREIDMDSLKKHLDWVEQYAQRQEWAAAFMSLADAKSQLDAIVAKENDKIYDGK
jgi:hypothetical protein